MMTSAAPYGRRRGTTPGFPFSTSWDMTSLRAANPVLWTFRAEAGSASSACGVLDALPSRRFEGHDLSDVCWADAPPDWFDTINPAKGLADEKSNHSLSCPAKAGHPVTTALPIGAAPNKLRWLLGRRFRRR